MLPLFLVAAIGIAQDRETLGIDGIYVGRYRCAQGWTDVRINIPKGAYYGDEGIFAFGGNGPGNGAFSFTLRFDEGQRYSLQPTRWVHRPARYEMVGAELTIAGGSISGRILDPRCGEISARRIAGDGSPMPIASASPNSAPSSPAKTPVVRTEWFPFVNREQYLMFCHSSSIYSAQPNPKSGIDTAAVNAAIKRVDGTAAFALAQKDFDWRRIFISKEEKPTDRANLIERCKREFPVRGYVAALAPPLAAAPGGAPLPPLSPDGILKMNAALSGRLNHAETLRLVNVLDQVSDAWLSENTSRLRVFGLQIKNIEILYDEYGKRILSASYHFAAASWPAVQKAMFGAYPSAKCKTNAAGAVSCTLVQDKQMTVSIEKESDNIIGQISFF